MTTRRDFLKASVAAPAAPVLAAAAATPAPTPPRKTPAPARDEFDDVLDSIMDDEELRIAVPLVAHLGSVKKGCAAWLQLHEDCQGCYTCEDVQALAYQAKLFTDMITGAMPVCAILNDAAEMGIDDRMLLRLVRAKRQ